MSGGWPDPAEMSDEDLRLQSDGFENLINEMGVRHRNAVKQYEALRSEYHAELIRCLAERHKRGLT